MDHRLRLNVTGFHYDYNDLQVQTIIAAGVTSISNAATAKVNGIELEAVAKPTNELTFSGNVVYLDAKYDRYPSASVPASLISLARLSPRYDPAPVASTRAAIG